MTLQITPKTLYTYPIPPYEEESKSNQLKPENFGPVRVFKTPAVSQSTTLPREQSLFLLHFEFYSFHTWPSLSYFTRLVYTMWRFDVDIERGMSTKSYGFEVNADFDKKVMVKKCAMSSIGNSVIQHPQDTHGHEHMSNCTYKVGILRI